MSDLKNSPEFCILPHETNCICFSKTVAFKIHYNLTFAPLPTLSGKSDTLSVWLCRCSPMWTVHHGLRAGGTGRRAGGSAGWREPGQEGPARYTHLKALECPHWREETSRSFPGAILTAGVAPPAAPGLHPWPLAQCVVFHSWWLEAAIRNQPAAGGAGRGWQKHGHMPGTGSWEGGRGQSWGPSQLHIFHLLAQKPWPQKAKPGGQILLFLLSTSLQGARLPPSHTSNPEPGCPRGWLARYPPLAPVSWRASCRGWGWGCPPCPKASYAEAGTWTVRCEFPPPPSA